MAKPNLPDELQPSVLAQPRHRLRHPKHARHDIMAAVPEAPQLMQPFNGLLDLRLPARLQHRLHLDRVRRVHHPKHILPGHEPEPGPRALQIVDRLPHVPLGRKHQRGQPVIRILDLLRAADVQQALHQLCVCQACVPQDCTAGLEGFDDLVGGVASEGEARGGGVDLHCSPQGLLRAGGHAVGFVEDDELVPPWGEGDFLLSESLDAVADDVDTCSKTGARRS